MCKCVYVCACVRACVCLFICVCVFVYVSFLYKCMLPGSSNSEKIHRYRIEHFQSNGASPVFLLLNLNLHFQGQTFGILFDLWISHIWWEIEQTLLLPSNRKSCICHRMPQLKMLYIIPWPTFAKIWNSNIWKTVSASKKCLIMTFIDIDICYRMGPL